MKKPKIRELREMSNQELLIKKKEYELMVMGSYSISKPLIKPQQRREVKKLIARINTLLKENAKK